MHALIAPLALLLAVLALVFGALAGAVALALVLGGRRLPLTPPQATRRSGAHHPGFGP